MVNTIIKVLKCLSIIALIGSPKNLINNPIMINLPPLPKIEAIIKIGRLIWNTPAVIEKTLYGIGVNAAVNITKKLCASHWAPTLSNTSGVKPGITRKKKFATPVNSPPGVYHKKYPIIIVENSQNTKLKEELEKKYSNVECILPEKNLGFGAGNNLGIKNSKTKYVLTLNPDTILYENTISKKYQL